MSEPPRLATRREPSLPSASWVLMFIGSAGPTGGGKWASAQVARQPAAVWVQITEGAGR